MADSRDVLDHLRTSREYLAVPGRWTHNIGFVKGPTCAIGALAVAYGWPRSHSTDGAINWLEEYDGRAVVALAKALPGGRDPAWGATGSPVKIAATEVYCFNDRQGSVSPVLKLFDDAIASLETESDAG